MGANLPWHTTSVLHFPVRDGTQKRNDVERINQFEIYEIGQTLQKLRAKEHETDPTNIFFELVSGRGAVSNLSEGKPMPIGVSQTKARELLQAIDAVFNLYFFEKSDDGKTNFKFPAAGTHKIQPWEWKGIVQALEKFETVLAEDMRENATYYVPRRGIFSTKALVDAADEAFMPELKPFIPAKTIDDWRAAGRCLAFNLLSASGFHVARAVEGTLEVYFQYFCSKPADVTLHSWNDYIQALESLRKSKSTILPSDKTLAELRQMKDDYRNPIAHPRIVLSEADARILFNNGESLIIGMAQELYNANRLVQPSLNLVAPGVPVL